jgi:hypothetical protein
MNKKVLIPEVLQHFNDGDTLSLLRENVTNEALKNVFGYGFIPKGKWALPDGIPPFKEDAAPEGMTPGNLWNETRSFQRFLRDDLSSSRREQLFIQLIENIHASEVKVVLAIKDQTLDKLYPNITLDKVVDAGFFVWPHGIDEAEYRAGGVTNVEVPLESSQPDSGSEKKRGRPKKEAVGEK